jgi:hypothetical protein
VVRKLLFTLAILTFGLLTPILEISSTHVFNPDWPGHARLHNLWQLMTHSMIALYLGWMVWRYDRMREACLFALLITTGFLAAYFLSPLYGGTMKHSDGSELVWAGMNSAVIVMVLASAILGWLFVTTKRDILQKSSKG